MQSRFAAACAVGMSVGSVAFGQAGPPGNRVHVNITSSGGDGSSWLLAHNSLQDALSSFELLPTSPPSQHEVWVAQGTYRPDVGTGLTPGDEDLTFGITPDVMVIGGFEGDETDRMDRRIDEFEVVLSGDLAVGGNSVHVAVAIPDSNGTGANLRHGLNGVTVRGGRAMFAFPAPPPAPPDLRNGRGGGFYAGDNAWPRLALAACTFVDNEAATGGAVYVDTGFAFNQPPAGGPVLAGADVLVCSNVFTDNHARIGPVPPNVAATGGGAMALYGAGQRIAIINNVISGNTAEDLVPNDGIPGGGGGLAIFQSAQPFFVNNTIVGNRVVGDQVDDLRGGGVYVGREFAFEGLSSTQVDITNAIIWDNRIRDDDSSFESQVEHLGGSGAFSHVVTLIDHSCVQNLGADPYGIPVVSSIESDPRFSDGSVDGRFELSSCSPCIEAGTNLPWASGIGSDDADIDDDLNRTEATPDVERDKRLVFIVDMGANELQDGEACPADLDGDGMVGFTDLATLLSEWDETNSPADLDGSGLVDTTDLLTLLAAWGICPGCEASGLVADDLVDYQRCLDAYASDIDSLIKCIDAVHLSQQLHGGP